MSTQKWNPPPKVDLPEKYRETAVIEYLPEESSPFPGDDQAPDASRRLWQLWPKPVDLDEWLSIPHEPEPEIVRGLLRRGEKLTLGGASKSKKTWIVASLALAVSAGVPWLGFQTVKTPVLFLNLELPEHAFHSRLCALRDALGIEPGQADFLAWNLRGCRASIEVLEQALEAHQLNFGLLVLDPLYKVLGGRVENSAEEMAELLGHMEAIATRHRCALVVPAHFSKGGQAEKDSIDRIAGSGVFARDADAIIPMTAHEVEDCFVIEPTLRSFPPVAPFVVRWDYPVFRRQVELDPSKLRKAGRKPTFDPRGLVDILPPEGLSATEWFSKAKEQLGISKTSFHRLQSELQAAGEVRRDFGKWRRDRHL